MSEENDNFKNVNDSVTVNNALPNPENNETSLNNNVNIKPTNPMPNKENVMPTYRTNMISKATEFLTAEKIRNTPIEKKVNFLRSRGLTEHEIQLSLQKAAAIYNGNQNFYAQTNDIPINPSAYNYLNTSDVSGNSESWLRQLAGSVAIGATAVYIGYQIYKKYLENWLFGMKLSPVEKRLEVVELLVQRCIVLIEEKNNITECSTEQNNRQKELDQIRAELKSIKSLLLNRSQFPPAPASSSIPQWQLVKNSKAQPEPQNKVNAIDILNSPQTGILNGHSSISVVPQTCDVLVSDTIKDNDSRLTNSKADEITLPLNSNQDTVNNHVELINLPHDIDNGDGNL